MPAALNRIIVVLFAIVGFIGSIVTIYSYIHVERAQLHVRVYPHAYYVPDLVAKNMTTLRDGIGRTVLNGLIAQFCVGRVPKKGSDINLKACSGIDDIRQASDVIAQLTPFKAGSSSTMFDYRIENLGNKVARSIKMSSNSVELVEAYYPSGKTIKGVKNEDEGDYALPDLNPNEKYKVLVWTTVPTYDDIEYLSFWEIPTITFSDGSVSQVVYLNTPPIYHEIDDFLNTFWWPISLVLVLALCSLIGIVCLLGIMIGTALLAGKSISSVFSQPKKPNSVEAQPLNE